MSFKFEKLEVWQSALDYSDLIYEITEKLPKKENFNLVSQMERAATSISLNIAEGSTGQSDAEQAKFLGYAIRSLVETVACLHHVKRRNYLEDAEPLRKVYRHAEGLFAKLQAMRKSIAPNLFVKEEQGMYEVFRNDGEYPF
jgi:four helix bundle protein